MNKFTKYIPLILFIFIILFLVGRVALTGQVIEEKCTEKKVCINETVTLCDEDCQNICVNETKESCELVPEEICEEKCVTENENEICNEVCETIEKEICNESTQEICNEVCEKVNCTEKVIENCSIKTICENITINETPTENVEENLPEETEKLETEETIIQPEVEKPITYSLSNEEINLVKEKTGEIFVKTTKSEIINERLVIRLEVGDFWIENSYDYPNSEEEIKKEIELNKIKFLKQIANEIKMENKEEKGEFLVNYEI